MADAQIVWLRRDLRLCDQAAFHAAAQAGPVIPVYILDDETPGDRQMGGASRWWLHHSLASLEKDLARHHSRLILRKGNCVAELVKLAGETGARTIHALHCYEPWWREAEREVSERLDLVLHHGNYLLPPAMLITGSGSPYKIFTPFKNALLPALDGFDILPEPALSSPETWPVSDALADWHLLPSGPDWAGGIRDSWTPGTAAALERFESFIEVVGDYGNDRNMPSVDGSSRMSPHLHFGEVSVRQLWHQIARHRSEGARVFRSELVWRDFAQNLICQFPDYPERPYRDGYDESFWRTTDMAADLAAWQQGCTGYPIVDAGMRQLWQTGWIHNRVRMITASFLTKHLLIDWRHGERWFWDTLVDADYASNGTNWQWVSGTGVDSNMFVRIMAPLSQSEKFDAAGYIRKYVPELAELPDAEIHDPSDMFRPATYPPKLIGHREGRERALVAYHTLKGK